MESQPDEVEELWKMFKELKSKSQQSYLEWREPNDPPFSKLVTEIDQVFQCKRKQKLAKIYEYFYDNDKIDKKISAIEKRVKKTSTNQPKTLHYWITINPEEKIELKELKTAVQKLVERTFIEKYMYVIEQRGANRDEVGKGKHVHLYFKIYEQNYMYPSKVIDRMKSTLKKVVNVNTKALWIQVIREEYAKDKILYMIDKKTDEGKPEKQEMDQIYREINNLDNYYTNMEEDLLTEPFINCD